MSNYAIKFDLKGSAGIDVSKFAEEANLDKSKSNVDELDINKLKTLPMI